MRGSLGSSEREERGATNGHEEEWKAVNGGGGAEWESFLANGVLGLPSLGAPMRAVC